jgi:hypothetical protein
VEEEGFDDLLDITSRVGWDESESFLASDERV